MAHFVALEVENIDPLPNGDEPKPDDEAEDEDTRSVLLLPFVLHIEDEVAKPDSLLCSWPELSDVPLAKTMPVKLWMWEWNVNIGFDTKSKHTVEISGFICHSDFTWNQFWIIVEVLKLPFFGNYRGSDFCPFGKLQLSLSTKMKKKKNFTAFKCEIDFT